MPVSLRSHSAAHFASRSTLRAVTLLARIHFLLPRVLRFPSSRFGAEKRFWVLCRIIRVDHPSGGSIRPRVVEVLGVTDVVGIFPLAEFGYASLLLHPTKNKNTTAYRMSFRLTVNSTTNVDNQCLSIHRKFNETSNVSNELTIQNKSQVQQWKHNSILRYEIGDTTSS